MRRTAAVTAAVLAGVLVVDYVDRIMIAVALPFLRADLDRRDHRLHRDRRPVAVGLGTSA